MAKRQVITTGVPENPPPPDTSAKDRKLDVHAAEVAEEIHAETGAKTEVGELHGEQVPVVETEPVVPDPVVPPPSEDKVNEVVTAAEQVAAPFIKSASANKAFGSVAGLAPVAVHLGFLLAHLLHDHIQLHKHKAAQTVPPPDPEA